MMSSEDKKIFWIEKIHILKKNKQKRQRQGEKRHEIIATSNSRIIKRK